MQDNKCDHAWLQITTRKFEDTVFETYMPWAIRGCKLCHIMQFHTAHDESYKDMLPVYENTDTRPEPLTKHYWRRLALLEDGYYDL